MPFFSREEKKGFAQVGRNTHLDFFFFGATGTATDDCLRPLSNTLADFREELVEGFVEGLVIGFGAQNEVTPVQGGVELVSRDLGAIDAQQLRKHLIQLPLQVANTGIDEVESGVVGMCMYVQPAPLLRRVSLTA